MKKFFVFLMLAIAGILSAKASGPSGTLPVIYVNIENGAEVVSKETYLKADYWLDPKGVSSIEAIGSQASPLTTKIKGRGNYTFTGFDKKPYRLKLDKKQKLCGMKSSKHFGLLAHADDNRGFLRNALGFKASEIVGLPWTPAQYPVELVINGTYRGLYFLTELIRIDKDRVNITSWGEEDENGAALDKWIEGGTLVELDNYEEEAQIQFNNPGAPEPLRFTYDKSVDPGFEPDGYVNWLKSSLGHVNDLILHGDRNSDELWNYVDIDDLARFIAVQEFTDNYESFHGSCYLFRDLGDGEKWHFSPVWDFGSAFQRSHPNHPFYELGDGNMHYNHWIGELLQFPALKAKVAEYWAILKSNRDALNSYADSFIAQITSAAAADKQRWPQYGNDNLQGKLNEVKGYLNSAANFMNSYYGTGGEENAKDFYLVGGFNGWSLMDYNYKFTKRGDVYVYECPTAITDEWKINDGSWSSVDLGESSGAPSYNKVYTLRSQGGNIGIDLPAGAKIILAYNEDEPSTIMIQTEPEQDNYFKTIRFIDTHATDRWEQVFVWIYNGDNPDEDFVGGQKPGAAMIREEVASSAMRAAGDVTWVHSFNPGKEVPNMKVVFSNGDSTTTTDETDYRAVISRDTVTGICETVAEDGYSISVKNGMLVVESEKEFDLTVSTISGVARTFHIGRGITVITLDKGLYIVNNRKVMI